MSPSGHSTAARDHKSVPCRYYSQGHCRFGDKCKFSHASEVQHAQPAPKHTQSNQLHSYQHLDSPSSAPASGPSQDTSDARPRFKHGENPCHAWKAGTCARGSKCRFRHDVDTQKPGFESSGLHKQKPFATSRPESVVMWEVLPASRTADLPRAEHSFLEAEHVRLLETEATAAHVRADSVSREEAAKMMSQVVSGSIVTFNAGLDVANLITGFETCTLRIGNLPLDVREDDVQALLIGQGLDVHHLHFVIKKKPGRRLEAHIVTDIAAGRALAQNLDGAEYQEEALAVEMSATNSLEGMSAGTGPSSEILTISWRAPSVRYVAEYADVNMAKAMVEKLDHRVIGGRRVKVEMNAQPCGRFVPNLRLNAVKISNLPPSITDEDVVKFTGSSSVKRLPLGVVHDIEQVARLILADIERVVPKGLTKFDNPPSTCTMQGVVSARAHFSSWDEAHVAYTHLSNKRYGNQLVWLRLPDPMHFTLSIPAEQYNAQKTQWDSLLGSIKDRKACTFNVRDYGNAVCIRLSGSVKEATGPLKVRIENLARGEKVEGWHRSLSTPSNPFVSRLHSETGAYLRVDWKRKSLKVYGTSRAVDHAREMIKGELERLASMDYTITLARHSVGFFVRGGLQQLRETLGENNVRFAMSCRKITVSGGEEARHALDRLITLSREGKYSLPGVPQGGETCPICYDSVSSPHQLGCGHTYCVACLRHFISSALESDQLPLTCLGDEARCNVPISIPKIQQFLPPASFNRLLEAAFDAYIAKHPEEFKHCKTPDCVQIYRAVKTGAAPQTLHCPSCFSAVCNACHEDAHDGFTCAESKVRRDPAEQERLNDTWIASQGGRVKKCPQCSVPIEKLEGCNHMTCRCGAHICWRCMGIFSAETIYDHMHSAHGTIHGDAPVVPEPLVDIGIPVDVEEQRALFRQFEARRIAGLQNANGARPAWYEDHRAFLAAHQRQLEEVERLERLDRLRRQQEIAEQERRVREQRLQREAEQRRRAQEQESGGWGCTIM